MQQMLNPLISHHVAPREMLMDYVSPVREQSGFLRNISLGYQLGSAFFTAHEEGILSALMIPRALSELASVCKIHPEKLRLLLGMLVSGEVIRLSEGRYQVNNDLIPFLDKNSMFYAQWIDHEAAQRHQWMDLGHYIRDEIKRDTIKHDYLHVTKSEIQKMGMQSLLGRLQGIVKILKEEPAFASSRRLLDLGGGHGLIGIACAQANPAMKVVIYDRPSIVQVAWEHVCSYGVEDRVVCIGGDYTTGRIGSGYDIILQICPSDHDPDLDHMMIQTIGEALTEGGLYVRCGFFLDDDYTGPLITTSFALAAEMQGFRRHRTIGELSEFIQSAGMEVIRTTDMTPYCDLPMYMVIGKVRSKANNHF